jgi:hypothetical protein
MVNEDFTTAGIVQESGEEYRSMLSLLLSTIAFIVASYFIKRYLNELQIPRSMTRSIVIFVLAAMIAYGVGFIVDWIVA